MNIAELRKRFFVAPMLVFMASAVLAACSTTEEETLQDAMKTEICLEADAGLTDCPRELRRLSHATFET